MRSHVSRNPWQAKTHTWQVDATAGLDANSGNAAAPIQTRAKVNALPLKSGDRVLFKRGETWAGQFTMSASGRPGREITFADYGAGALPVLTSVDADNFGIAVFSVNHLIFRNLALTSETTTYAAIYVAESHDVYIFDCTTVGGGVGVAIRGDDGASYRVTVHGCECSGGLARGVNVFAQTGGGTHLGPNAVIVEHCSLHHNGTDPGGDHGVYFCDTTNSIIRYCTAYANSAAGIKLGGFMYGNNEGNEAYGNYCYDQTMGIVVEIDGNRIYNNLFRSNQSCIVINYGDNNLFYHNTAINPIEYFALNFSFASVAIDGNVFKNNLYLASIGQDSTYRQALVAIPGTGQIANLNTFDKNLYFYDGATLMDLGLASAGTHLTMAQWQALTGSPDPNSITGDPLFVSSIHTTVDADSASGQKVLSVASTTGFAVGNVVVVNSKGARQEVRTIDTIQAGVSLTMTVNLTYTHTAVQADGVYSCVYTDLHLQAGSPCIGAGDNTVGISLDKDGNARGASVDIGCYEFVV
jgi:hypothetical protein